MWLSKWFSRNVHKEVPRVREVEPSNFPHRDAIIAALREIRDPELPLNIYDLGLIYAIGMDEADQLFIRMTLTTPACPVAQTFPKVVADRLRRIEGISDVQVELVWDPPWSQDRLSKAARLQLGLL